MKNITTFVENGRTVIIDYDKNIVTKRWKKIDEQTGTILNKNWLKNQIEIFDNVCPNRLISYGENGDQWYIIYEYVEGITFRNFLRGAIHTLEDPQKILFVIKEMCNCVIDNILKTFPYVHSDLNCGNILITQDDPIMCEFIDFDTYILSNNVIKIKECIIDFVEKLKKQIVDIFVNMIKYILGVSIFRDHLFTQLDHFKKYEELFDFVINDIKEYCLSYYESKIE